MNSEARCPLCASFRRLLICLLLLLTLINQTAHAQEKARSKPPQQTTLEKVGLPPADSKRKSRTLPLWLLTGSCPEECQLSKECGSGSPEGRIRSCSRLIEKGSRNDLYYERRGVAYREIGQTDLAIADFSESIRLSPSNVNALMQRGELNEHRKDVESAISDYATVIRIDPKYWPAYFRRGVLLYQKGNFDGSVADYNSYIQLSSQPDPAAYYNRAISYLAKRDLDHAIPDYTEAIRLNPKFENAFLNRGIAFQLKNDLGNAIDDFTAAILLNPANSNAYLGRGEARRSLGQVDLGRADLREALRLDPSNERARAMLSGALPRANAEVSPPVPAQKKTVVERRVALIVGNSTYKNVRALPNPASDADAVGDALRGVGFQSVVVKKDLTRDQLSSALRAFANEAATADWSLVYYSGYAIQIGRTNYLIPTDAALNSDDDVSWEAISLDVVLNVVERSGGLRLVLLDASWENPFQARMKPSKGVTRGVSRGLGLFEPQDNTLVASAAQAGQIASLTNGKNSPFATAFVNNIKTPDLDVKRLLDIIRDDVVDATNGQQIPARYGETSSRQRYYFVGR